MTEITDLSTTDSSNTSISGESLDGAIANMGRMDNTLQATMGMLARSIRSNVMRWIDGTDSTKRVAMDLSGISTGTTQTLAVPNYSGVASVQAKGAAIASAATTDLNAATGDFVHITGTTTITSFGTAPAGVKRNLVFDGSLLLTASSVILIQGGVNVQTAAGDTATVISEGSGVWRVVTYISVTNPAIPTSWERIFKSTFSAQSNVPIVSSIASCRFIRIKGSIIMGTSTGIGLQFSNDSGATWKQGASDYTRNELHWFTNAAASTVSTNSIIFLNAVENVDINFAVSFDIEIDNVGGTNVMARAKASFIGATTGAVIETDLTGRMTVVNGPISGVRIIPAAGSISGFLYAEGIRQ